MKKYNINTIEEFKLNAVGADASVRLRKDQNKDNIKIFERIEFSTNPFLSNGLKKYAPIVKVLNFLFGM